MKNLLQLIESIGFSPKSGLVDVWSRVYDDYEIIVRYDHDNPENSVIDYGKKIKAGRKTTCNFHQTENFVVLECVNRLLEKGYKPDSIELEKTWNLGHKGKGFLDILVKDLQNQSFLMIECKVWGRDFETEIKNTLNKSKNGSQIFSYLQQEPKTTEAICLYTYNPDTKEYKSSIVYNHKDWADLNQEDRYNRWLGKFEDNGIFEEWVKPYSLQSKALTKKDLKPLSKADGDNIYNKFAEILRHNVISDKSNAFNKIINLFLCKIYDEDTNDDEELKFQTRSGTKEKTDEDLLLDLSDLYMNGMKYYLNKDIEDITLQEFRSIASRANNQELIDAYRQLRLYKDNVFGFREVFDKQSFKDNAKVVREIVELLQDKQLRYSHKQQFLGDFFENLLKDSIKQESGQFFTPVPITQFIINSIPLNEIILENIKNKKDDILPYTIDYAMGSGHFLTEVMDEYNKIIKTIDTSKIAKQSLKKEVESWQINDFAWAEKYVYGIDLDYRLVKTTKIACFLNGDGLANIIHADGLDSFAKSTVYKDKLKSCKNTKDNEQFDVLISNPPYAVRAFKNTLNDGANSFDLYKDLTDNSSEIECLFIERAKQLVRENGIVAIVLPVSVLTNNGIYEKTREILLKNFEFKAIVSLGGQAFAATNTKTVILFMKKRSSFVYDEIRSSVEKFFETYEDISINGIKNGISLYVNSVWDGLKYQDYVNLLKNEEVKCNFDNEICKEYRDLSKQEIIELEKEKLTYFALTYPQKIILADSKDKDTEKAFYGYEFSNRRGHEGIQIYRDADNNIKTKLFDCLDKYNSDKLNSYILNNFQNVDIEKDINNIKNNQDHALNGHVDYMSLSNLMSFDTVQFNKSLNLNAKKKIKFETRYPQEKFENLVDSFNSGVVYDSKNVSSTKTANPVLTADNINLYNHLYINKIIYLDNDINIDQSKKLKKDDIFICLSSGSLKHIGKVAFITKDTNFYAGGFMGIIKANKNKILPEYMFYILSHSTIKNNIEVLANGNNINNLAASLNVLKLPLPPLDIQRKIIEEIRVFEEQEAELTKKVLDFKNHIRNLLNGVYNASDSTIRLSDTNIFSLSIGQRVLKKHLEQNGAVPVYSANVFEPFGYTNNMLIKDFDIPSVLWGIDGDWMVNYIPENQKFYPTDHCGVLRVLDTSIIHPKYIEYALLQQGIELGFSRTKRASIDRIQNIKIPLPDIKEQKKIVKQVFEIEKESQKLEKIISDVSAQKDQILNKYLL